MKLLWALAVVLLAVWLWRSARPSGGKPPSAPKPPPPTPQDMVACRVCGVHLPEAEATRGRLGHYCSSAHREQAQD